jgi:choline dehydrogenase
LPAELWRYLRHRQGLLAMPSADVFVFHESGVGEPGRPDVQVHFTPASGIHDEVSGKSVMDPVPGVTAITYPMHPTSRGSVLITDADVAAEPEITANYLSTDHDKQVLLAGIRTLRRIYDSEPMRTYRRGELRPGMESQSDDELLAMAGRQGTTGYHPVGTCRMGTDADAVVDPDLKLRGLSGLSVIDASVMPKLTSGNTMAATYMIAENGAAKLLREHEGAVH